MIISCQLIPEHNPGDDVLRFDMRLLQKEDNTTSENCFCLEGHACDDTPFVTRHHDINNNSEYCAIPSLKIHTEHDERIIDTKTAWRIILSPFTKWDAARFLNLAVQPTFRDPSTAATKTESSSSQLRTQIKQSSIRSWDDSEQSHAFLPMFPIVLRYIALILYRIVPSQLLPPTFEALVVWSGILFNNVVCLIVSIIALFHLTTYNQNTIFSNTRIHDDKRGVELQHEHVAVAACLVFGIWNPASVFFVTNYSESFFAMTTLIGHVCIQCSNSPTLMIKSIGWWFLGITCWMIGSYTRSNGTVHCLWILQDGLARFLWNFRLVQQQIQQRQQQQHESSSTSVTSTSTTAISIHIFWILFRSCSGMFLVALPVRYHDWRGYQRHCDGEMAIHPEWCTNINSNDGLVSSLIFGSSFSLYRYIQDKHWNVGFFCYYQWKQIPNFLLAAPILILSVAGACCWIYWSLMKFGKGKLPSKISMILWNWPVDALLESVGETKVTTAATSGRDSLVDNPLLLAHYAILAILALVGLVIAHVQISTRMICSTSPAILWFITYCLSAPSNNLGGRTTSVYSISQASSSILPPSRLGKSIWFYTLLFMSLGVILHVNFLPWT
jgi:phosphatidylinositol glycan class V